MNLSGISQINGSIQGIGGADSYSLQPGDTLRGVVQKVENGQAHIRLSGGGELVAQLGEGVSVAEGDAIQLRVTNRAEGRLTMQLTHLLGAEAAQVTAEAEGSVQLSLNQPLSGDSLGAQISSWLKQYGVAPSREGVARARALMDAYPQLDVRTAAFLAANGQTAANAGTPKLDSLVTALMDAYAAAGAETSTNPIGVLLEAMEGWVENPPADLTFLPEGEAAGAPPSAAAPPSLGESAASLTPGAQGIPAEVILADASTIVLEAAPGETPVAAQPESTDAATQTAQAPLPPQGEAATALPQQAAAAPIPADATPAGPALAPDIQQAMQRYLQQAAPQAARALASADALPLAAQAIHTASQLPQDAGNALLQGLVSQMALPEDALPALLRASEAMRAVIQQSVPTDAASARLFAQNIAARLMPDAALEGAAGELNRTVTSLITNLQTLRTAFSAAPEQAAALLAAQAEARASALPSITQFHYMQIPVEMYQRQQVADLYVMKRNRSVEVEKDEYTIAIALETENMGRVEAIIRARDREVDVTFRMPQGEAAEAVRQSFDELAESIRDAGYTLRSAILSRLDKPISPQTFQQQMEEEELKLYTLDVMA